MVEERKRVFMVRHAQSEANVASARLENGEVSAIWGFLTMGSDAPLSDMGRQQLAAARVQLMGSRFIEERGVQLIAHSPLVRAQQTAHALFDECGVPFVELPFMYERTASEWVSIAGMDSRIEQLRSWLAERDEAVIVLVGHGQFFKHCLNRGFVQANVSVLECSFSARSGFALEAELHPAAEVAAQRVDGAGGAGVADALRGMRDVRLDGVDGMRVVAAQAAEAVGAPEAAPPAEAAAAEEAGAADGAADGKGEGEGEGEGADGNPASDAKPGSAEGAGRAGGVAESWWGGSSLRALWAGA